MWGWSVFVEAWGALPASQCELRPAHADGDPEFRTIGRLWPRTLSLYRTSHHDFPKACCQSLVTIMRKTEK